MTPEERAAHCRRIASLGGKRTVALHDTSHMSAIGRRGFAVAMALGWGPELAKKLAPSYEAKFGKPIVLGPQTQARARIRAEARAIYGGNPCEFCGAADTEVHHIHGLDVDNVNDDINIYVLCGPCHRELHKMARRARRLARGKVS
jgi:hypothetical protein